LKLAEAAMELLNGEHAASLKTEHTLQMMLRKWEDGRETAQEARVSEVSKTVLRAIYERQRQWLLNKNDKDLLLDEEVVRRHLNYLDLEEEKLNYI
jgi:CPA1 family monovalent cation:H+ antiporter